MDSSTDPAETPLRVLVIDDDEIDYLLTKRYLTQAKIAANVSWANTYHDAIATLATQQFDLLIVDYDLGAYRGTEVVMRARREGNLVPTIMLTGHDGSEVDREALRVGVTDFLVKSSIDAAALGRTVRFTLERDRTINALRRAEEQARHQALHDGLTGLPNRIFFVSRLEHAIATMRRDPRETFAVIYFDLDGFKSVNDSLGHDVGDAVLKETAFRLRRSTRDVDACCRLGGDEFTILLCNVGQLDHATAVSDALQAELLRPYFVQGQLIQLSGSIGLYYCDDVSVDALQAIRYGDRAMYRSKRLGKARCSIYDPTLDTPAPSDHQGASTNVVPAANASPEDAFQLTFLPQWELSDVSLLRLTARVQLDPGNHLGSVYPGQISERDRRLSQDLLSQAFASASCWPSHIQLAFRPSAAHLFSRSMIDAIGRALDNGLIAPRQLVIEISESLLASNFEECSRTCEELRKREVLVALTNYTGRFVTTHQIASLALVGLSMSTNELLPDNAAARELTIAELHLRAMIDFCRVLGIQVGVEAIEDASLLHLAHHIGASYGWGSHLAADVCEAEVGRLIAKAVHRGAIASGS